MTGGTRRRHSTEALDRGVGGTRRRHLTSLPTPIHKGGGASRRPPFVDSFMDGCGEAGEAQGILNGSNFVATS